MKRSVEQMTERQPSLAEAADYARDQLVGEIDALISRFAGKKTSHTSRPLGSGRTRGNFDFHYKRFHAVAEALTLWHEDEAFLSVDGTPRPLARAGRRSLETLAKRVAVTPTGTRRLVSDLIHYGLVKSPRDKFVPAGRSAVIGSANALNLAYATAAVTRLIQTIGHNISDGTSPLYERQLSEATIRAGDLPIYLRFVEQQAQYLIDAVDDWLSKRRIAGRSREHKVKVGIGAFAWTGVRPKPMRQ